MKRVTWQDLNGFKRVSLIKDTDSEEDAERGIPDGPPPIEDFDWEQFKMEVNNLFVDAGLNTWDDYQRNPQAVQGVQNLFRKRLLNFFRYNNGNGRLPSP